ncbi:glycosyltransferase family 2 protein [Glacieibacterium megasporae]|uniref:glycosyltransferase family 2 protein n=1 Tax=Glacieibacterium megasporae TaxID=2835787 RepID=UPI001C1E4382|nr:glycosyltransferase family 2 protein [Polymorphobacter megasporae]UAJ09805.1 glycosyltransferase family 2 protein [Polymorphobacter megasporae]
MTLRAAPSLDIVVPCYNEEEVLPETARQLTALLDSLLAAGNVTSAQVHFVDDGSRDRTWALIEQLHQADPRLCGIKLSRNRGHQNALMAGLGASTAAVVVSIDADLQDDPAIIADMVDAYRGGAEIVLGVRSDRGTDSAFKRLTGQGFYRFLKGMGVEIVYDHADYRLMSRRALNALAQYTETNLFLRALIPQLGFSVATVPYRRAERFAGESKYPLSKMLAFALDGLTSFSTRPLRLITLLGFLVSTVSFALGLWALSVAVFTTQGVPGWASTVVPIYLICGVQLLCIGIIGEYVGKIYFETKRRPRFIIDQMLGDDEVVVQSAKMSAIHTMAD